LTNGLVKRETGKPTFVVSDCYWQARLRTRDSARSRGSRVVSTHGLNTQRVSAVQKAWSSYVCATILLQHGPAAPPWCPCFLERLSREEDSEASSIEACAKIPEEAPSSNEVVSSSGDKEETECSCLLLTPRRCPSLI
jgi:hypothetical protein